MTRPSIYLSGPITGLSYEEARGGWRSQARMTLARYGIDVYSPMRGKTFLAGTESISAMAGGDHPMSTPKGITTRDRHDTRRCDALLVNLLGARRVSIGTMIELGWADTLGKPVVLVMEGDGSNPHEHVMVEEIAGYRVETLDGAAAILRQLLLPGI